MLKNIFKFIKENTSNEDLKILVLAIFSVLIVLFSFLSGDVKAATSYDISYQWSDKKYSMSIKDLYKLMGECGFDVSGEDFSTYTFTNEHEGIGSVSNSGFKNYNSLLSLLSGGSPVYFTTINYKNKNCFCILSPYLPYDKFYYAKNYNFYFFNWSNYIFFDMENNKIHYGYLAIQDADINKNNFIDSISYGNLSFRYADYTDMSLSYFQSYSFQQELFLDKFILANGACYSINYSNNDKQTVLNPVISYSYNGSGDATGSILYNDTLKEWLTIFNTDYFTSGEYAYYLEVHTYDYNYIYYDIVDFIYVSDLIFPPVSVTYPYSRYLPKAEDINNAIKSYDNYKEYCYALVLKEKSNPRYIYLSSEFIILSDFFNQYIKGFNQLYRYIPYYLYYPELGESGDASGDAAIGEVIVSPSGDSLTLGGGISGIWQAIINLPKTILDGIVGLFVPSSDYFYNESEESPGLWQRISSFFSGKLGFLWDVIMFVPNLFNSIIDLISSFTESWSIDVPDIVLPSLTGVEEATILKGFSWSPYDYINQKEEFRNLYDLYLRIIDMFVYWGLIRFAINTINLVFGNSDSEIVINE